MLARAGTPRRRSNKRLISRWREVRFLALLTGGLCVPALGTVVAIFASIEPDLSDLTPIAPEIGKYVILNWADLERHRNALQAGSLLFSGAHVQAIGYMFESDGAVRAGASVQDFVLLPDAGHIFHPAHRFGDQMISIHLAERTAVPFAPRSLLWVRGIFRAWPGDPAGARPLYSLEQAVVKPASKAELAKYFR